MSSSDIPSKMKGLFLTKLLSNFEEKHASEGLAVKEVDTPRPGHGEVLVQIHSSPVNPSDLLTLQGGYHSNPPLPRPLGNEGSGVVVKSGGGEQADKLVGKRVGVSVITDTSLPTTIWSQYAVVPASVCIPLPDDVSFDQGCALYVNPLTVISFVNVAKEGGHKTILHTAAASALGKMLIPYAKRHGIEVICVVRKAVQKEELLKLGAVYVVDTSVGEKEWTSELKKVCQEKNCTLGFDAIAGPGTAQLLGAMPPKSKLLVYGGLSGQTVLSANLGDVLFGGRVLGGFWLVPYWKELSEEQRAAMLQEAAKYAKEDFSFEVAHHTTLENFSKDVGLYAKDMSKGKLLVHPSKL